MNTATIPELTLDNGFVIPDVTLYRRPAFGKHLYDKELLCFNPGSTKEPMKRVTYLCDHPSDAGLHILKFSDGSRGPIPGDYIYLPPLTWVEGKPVYEGDTLYAKPDSFAYKNLPGFQEPMTVTGKGETELFFSLCRTLHTKDATWEKSHQPVLDKNGDEIKVGDKVWFQCLEDREPIELTIAGFDEDFAVEVSGFSYNLKHVTKKKPVRYININGFKVPEPMREAPEKGTTYYVVALPDNEPYRFTWKGDTTDSIWLAKGIIHATRQAAELHLYALLSFTLTK